MWFLVQLSLVLIFFFEKKDIAAHITFHFFLHEIDTLLVFLLVIRNTVC